jgi:hypothetical protein
MFLRLLAFSAVFVNSELISMTVCSDLNCKNDCVSWTSSTDTCVTCDIKKGDCSISNPSSIISENTISFFSDNACLKPIPNTRKIPFLTNSECNVLKSNYGYDIGSYKASNISMFLYVITGSLFTIAIVTACTCYSCFCKNTNIKTIKLKYRPGLRNRYTTIKCESLSSDYYPNNNGYQPPINYEAQYYTSAPSGPSAIAPPIPSAPYATAPTMYYVSSHNL